MKWGNDFEVASGIDKGHTAAGSPFEVTAFSNGDDLVWFPQRNQYVFFYRGKPPADKCQITGQSVYPIPPLPYHKGR